ncbi:MAG: DUF4097 family beta strand repeat protein [Thermotogae bacterium]|nr:DUF4097 family beta strand repeat protein [Thermotogota bacterium]
MKKTLDLEGVRRLSISTIGADVDIVPLKETGKKLVYEVFGNTEDYSPEIKRHGDVLILNFESEKKLLGFLPIGRSSDVSRVELHVPDGLRELKVRSTSGDIAVKDLNIDDLVMNTVSGDFHISRMRIDILNASNVSGCFSGKDISCRENCTVSTISGDCYLNFRGDGPRVIKASTVSGDLTVLLENIVGLEVKVSSVSGTFSHSIPLMKVSKGVYKTNGAVNRSLVFSSVSGDIILKSYEHEKTTVDDTADDYEIIMGEEARKIIRMLEDGKLTREQAEELLRALGYEENEISSLLGKEGEEMGQA